MATSQLPECRACDRETPLHCASCHHTPYCSVVCSQLLAATHPWVCAQPGGTFTFAPLTGAEAAQLKLAYTSSNVDMKGLWQATTVMQEHGWQHSDFPALFDKLALGTSDIAEPGRSAMLVELHFFLLNMRNLQLAPGVVLSPWGYTALTTRWILDGLRVPTNAANVPSYESATLADLAPVLHRVLNYWTIASPSLSGFTKTGIKRAQKLALARIEAASQGLSLGSAAEQRFVASYARQVVQVFVQKKV
ncbi:hypothetical protein JCM3775_005747 [Rhodotorula graminis]